MIPITYPMILRAMLFIVPLLACACWIDVQTLPRPERREGGFLRLRDLRSVRVYTLVLLGFSAVHFLSVVYEKIVSPMRLLANTYPYTTPYFAFCHLIDADIYVNRIAFVHKAAFWNPGFTLRWDVPASGILWQYPPAAVFPYTFLEYGGMTDERFFVLCAVLLTGLMLAFSRWLVGRGVQPLAAYSFAMFNLLLSYPFWTEVSDGNIEIFVFAFGAAAVLYYVRGEFTTAAILFGFMTGLKLFPFIYFGLFFARKQYRQIAYGLLTALAVNIAGLWWMAPGMWASFRRIQAGFAQNRDEIILAHRAITTEIDHSIFGFLKQMNFALRHHAAISRHSLTLYLVAGALAGLVLYFGRIVKLPLLNQILSLTVLTILLPPTSHDYTLMHLYVPWALLIAVAFQAAAEKRTIPGLLPCMVCMGALFASQMELIHQGISFNGQFKCVVLIFLLGLSLKFPLEMSSFGLPRVTRGKQEDLGHGEVQGVSQTAATA